MIPIPPSHCVNCRHISSERSTSPMFVTTLAPVAVNPDIDSNSASSGRSSCGSPLRTNGSAPKSAAATHVSATTR